MVDDIIKRLRDKSARFRKYADFFLNSVPGDPINNAAAKGLTADSDDLERAADLIEQRGEPLSDTASKEREMNEWKVVPVEPTDEQIDAALEYDIFDQVRGAGRIVALHLYQATLAAAPTPPVVLPPLPHPLTNIIDGDDWSDVFTADQMQAYARAALAQYGIKEQNDE